MRSLSHRLWAAAAFILISISSFASHTLGGQLYWKALGNNQYIFYVDRIDVCNAAQGVTMTMESTILSSPVTLYFTSSSNVNIPCNSCTGSFQFSKVQHFESNPVTLPVFAPGVAVHHFWTDLSFPSSGVQNLVNPSAETIYARSSMSVHGQNKSAGKYLLEQIFTSLTHPRLQMEPISFEADSMFIRYMHPWGGGTSGTPQLRTLASGYTAATPTSQGDSWMNQAGWFQSGISDSGFFTSQISSQIQFYEDSAWYARVNLNTTVYFDGSNGVNVSNNDPFLATFSAPSNSNWQVRDSVLYFRRAALGDSVEISFNVVDSDISGGAAQAVTASVKAGNLEGSGYITPTLIETSGVGPQSGGKVVTLKWQVPGTLPKGYYRFFVEFYDDQCPAPGKLSIPVEIYNEGIFMDDYSICSGSSVSLVAPFTGTTYQWQPTTGLSNPTSANTQASPTTTTTYTVFIDGDSVGVYTVHVGQLIIPTHTKPLPNVIELTNPTDYDEHALLYFNWPIAFDDTTFTVSAPGNYNLVGRDGGCYSLGPNVNVTIDSLFSGSTASSRMDTADYVTLASGDFYAVDLNSIGSSWIREIIFVGAEMTGKTGAVHLELFEDVSSNADTAYPIVLDGHSVGFHLDKPYGFYGGQIKLVVDSGSLRLPLISVQQAPLQVYSSAFGVHMAYIDSTHGHVGNLSLYNAVSNIAFRGDAYSSVSEWIPSIEIYPNPATDILRVQGLGQEMEYSIVALSGQLIQRGLVTDQVDVSSLKSGAYLIQFALDDEVQTLRLLIQ